MWKKSDPTDIWAWVYKDLERQQKKGGLAQTMAENYMEFHQEMDNDHIAAEIAISRALDAARTLGETKWELHLRHWRLQLWSRQGQVKRALPEAIDLLTLATDRRVKDVPQRICAYHDVVDCYVDIDSVGYYDEIVENSKDILAQLPKRHCCATCARSHLASTSAAAGKLEDAEYWLNQTKATMNERRNASLVTSFGNVNAQIGKFEDAERDYLEARNLAREHDETHKYIQATLNLTRLYLKQEKLNEAMQAFHEAHQMSKYNGNPWTLAFQLQTKALILAKIDDKATAIEHLRQAAQIYLDLGCYRDAADSALHAAELAHKMEQTPPEQILTIAAQAVGQLPTKSVDLYQRLANFEREPIVADPNAPALSTEEQKQKELATLQELLHKHMADGILNEATILLFRIGRWHALNNEPRAALDYFLWDAALERIVERPMREREDALDALKHLKERLPEGTIESAISALEDGPPPLLASFFSELPLHRWRWILRGIHTEIAGQPFVEPEPEADEDNQQVRMNEWLSYVVTMSALIVRFYRKITPEELRPWIAAQEEHLSEITERLQEIPTEVPEEELAFPRALQSLIAGIKAIAEGTPIEQVQPTVQEPFTQVIERIAAIAQEPVWFHPEASPLDFLVEHAAQKAVRALKLHDENRIRRLQNIALRYKLMNFDLKEEEELLPIARFLDALSALVLADGKHLPTVPLEAPFDSILAAVYEAGQNTDDSKAID